MTIASDARETRAAMRSAFTLVRLRDEESEAILDALENAMEAYVDRCEQFALGLETLFQDDALRTAVLKRAATLMGRGDYARPGRELAPRPVSAVPLRLVRDVYNGETVA